MKFFLVVFALCGAWTLHGQPVLRLQGSTTVKGALALRQADIEAEIGGKLDIQAVGSNAGLLALIGERTDMAMIASPLEEIARRLNQKKSGTIDPAAFHAAEIGAVRLAFIVNPYNPVRHLSAVQLGGLLTGKIRNWKEVGGQDIPVLVVSLANASSLVEDQLLQGEAITADARRVPTATQIPPVVALEPGAIGIISVAHTRGKTSLVTTDAKMLVPLYLVTRGEPDPLQRKLIETARKVLRETS